VVSVNSALETIFRKQRTIKEAVNYSGIGVHTGTEVHLRFIPAECGTGVVFKRVDLPGKPVIPATIEYVCDTARSTTIGVKDVRVHTVEHLMAAVKAFDIDNLIIEISSIEPPIGNGSSDVFVEAIEKAGIVEQHLTIPIIKLKKPVFISEGDIQVVGIPYDGYRVSYTLNYPNSPVLKAQFHSIEVTKDNFKNEIAPCRTFSLYEEVSMLMDRGLIKGGSLDNAVIIKDDVVFSKNGLFFSNEMARHKILDLIGDLSLIGLHFHAHILSIRSGHATNFSFAKKLYNYLTMEDS
jgi:UDP-3-O-[3-hydroxymyristoyl] N-acetylglucosamine deacetylase